MSMYPKTIYAPFLNHMKRAATQTRKHYGLKVLTKIPSLYEVPELRNLNFCCCTVCFLGTTYQGSWGGGGEMTMGLMSSQKH